MEKGNEYFPSEKASFGKNRKPLGKYEKRENNKKGGGKERIEGFRLKGKGPGFPYWGGNHCLLPEGV